MAFSPLPHIQLAPGAARLEASGGKGTPCWPAYSLTKRTVFGDPLIKFWIIGILLLVASCRTAETNPRNKWEAAEHAQASDF